MGYLTDLFILNDSFFNNFASVLLSEINKSEEAIFIYMTLAVMLKIWYNKLKWINIYL